MCSLCVEVEWCSNTSQYTGTEETVMNNEASLDFLNAIETVQHQPPPFSRISLSAAFVHALVLATVSLRQSCVVR